MPIRLLADRIAIRPDDESLVSSGGIHLVKPDRVSVGTVVSVGPGSYNKDGKRKPVSINVGDRVKYLTNNEQEVEIDDKKLVILTEDSILAVL